mgnify:CR=1 FL=1
MSKINLHNYEAYFLDRAEGNLTAAEELQLKAFLEEHPDLKADLEDFENIQLTKEEVSIPKLSLLRNEETGLLQKEHLLIASVEGALNAKEQKELNTLMEEDPNLLDELALYEKTKLPQERLPFADKDSLKKKQGKLIYWQFYAAAASVAAALLSIVLLNTPSAEPLYETASVQKFEQVARDSESANFGYIIQAEAPKKKSRPTQAVENSFAKVESATNQANKADRNQPPLKKLDKQVEFAELEQVEVEPKAKEAKPLVLPEQSVIAALPDDTEALESRKGKTQSLSLKEFAKETIQNELLKNKTVTQLIAEELASATNEKVVFEPASKANKKGLQFAMNLGSISISKK